MFHKKKIVVTYLKCYKPTNYFQKIKDRKKTKQDMTIHFVTKSCYLFLPILFIT